MPGSLAEELGRELADAERVVGEQVEATEPLLAGEECIAAIGAGDSYAAALAAEGAAGGRVVALDPFDASRSGLLRVLAHQGCVLLPLSVGGRTRAVVEAAREYRGAGGRVVAVTANPDSPLARAASRVVRLVYGGLAAGVGALRHLAMVAALARLVSGSKPSLRSLSLPGDCGWLLDSEAHVGGVEASSTSLYAALKLYEVFGSRVEWWRLEQFLHAPVYSVHAVTFYESPLAADRTREAYSVAKSAGLKAWLVSSLGDPWENVLAQSLETLRCLAAVAERLGVDVPSYRRHRGLEQLTRLIYG